jgi:drug/metabolite transporter (DMT)-like permease
MRTTPVRGRVSRSRLAVAVILLLGIVVVAYGYGRQSDIALYAGLLITVAAVLVGIVQIVTPRDR